MFIFMRVGGGVVSCLETGKSLILKSDEFCSRESNVHGGTLSQFSFYPKWLVDPTQAFMMINKSYVAAVERFICLTELLGTSTYIYIHIYIYQ